MKTINKATLTFAVLLAIFGCSDNDSTKIDQPIATNHDIKADETIVFVGNSLTYANDLPKMFKEIGATNGNNIATYSYARGGYELIDLYKEPDAVNLVKRHRPAYLVIQEQSQTVDLDAIQKWLALGDANGAKVILYHTWVDNCQAMMDKAQIPNLTIAPVGYAFNKFDQGECACPTKLDSLPILNPVGDFHPSLAGSYLASLTIYQTIYGKSPINPPRNKTAEQYWPRFMGATCVK